MKNHTEEEKTEAHREAVRRYRIGHPIQARAHMLVQNYRQEDKKYNRGECTLTAKWVVENILSKPCSHCGKEGWDVIGCNRIDNSKPHTMDNVEPCCKECNHKLALPYISKITSNPVYQIDKTTNEILHIWPSAFVAAKENNYTASRIRDCCNGGYFDYRRNKWVNIKTYKGYAWKYKSGDSSAPIPLRSPLQLRNSI